jgi:hypothetical protein
MPNFRLIADIKNVTENDVNMLAQKIWEEEGDDYDASLGDFKLRIVKVEPGGAQFDTNWEPRE